jgi:lipopolysaccharide cholinephosphotransferase
MFEGRKFDAPTYPEAYLAKRYGDFKTPPSQSEIKNELTCELTD